LVDSVVFKDLLDLSLIENREGALNLLKLLAYQIGSLVNYAELATRLGMEAKTIKRYINLFEQSFIVFKILPYSTKKRDEIGKMPKIYFYDLGLRNAIIENFQPINSRPDGGSMFENFVIAEVIKTNYYEDLGYKLNYWRTKQGSEIDLVLFKTNGELKGVEIKTTARASNKAFLNRYPQAKMMTITKQNFY
jgi:predicted AAA+ superfamily ATPase